MKDQPNPIKNNHPPLWPQVIVDARIAFPREPFLQSLIQDMVERDKVGVERYGMQLQPFNGRDSLIDAYQELLDSLVYLKAVIIESQIGDKALFQDIYSKTLLQTLRVREILSLREITRNA